MIVLAIDPGPEQSAFVRYENGRIDSFGMWPNDKIQSCKRAKYYPHGAHLVVEMIASYGMPVGAEVFSTCVWIGRFVQAWDSAFTLLPRREVKLHLCGQARAKDGNVRQALIDRYGGKDKAIGKKALPGPLYGIKADCWQALAVAVTWSDLNSAAKEIA